ncbi:hypothetical protein RvY_10437 [Ramazzottius varieornatus]|uniref:Uncharacterized protein n=1 Tax=Ramazzottius varieornatus TaxID=947166 RepID=A0A1D1VH82_RAMVA|nr:hypothetical protein RvY_10437 [Ramazzottius varieornatus]
MKNIDWGWQLKARNLRHRGEYLFKNMPIPADITFHLPTNNGKIETIAARK